MADGGSVICVGLTTVDVIHRVTQFPGSNEKIESTRTDIAAGGPAANAAVIASRLGSTTTLITSLGTGPLAGVALQDLTDHGVTTLDCRDGSGDLPVSAIIVDSETGDRMVVGQDAVGFEVIVPDRLDDLIARADALLIDGHHADLARAAVNSARDASVPVVLDGGSWKPILDQVLPMVDYALLSAVFRTPEAVTAEETASQLISQGVPFVAVSDGGSPVRWWSGTADGSVMVPSVEAQDTLGAGDAFHGAFAHAVSAGVDATGGLRFAVSVASTRVRHIGPRSWLDDPALGDLALRSQDAN